MTSFHIPLSDFSSDLEKQITGESKKVLKKTRGRKKRVRWTEEEKRLIVHKFAEILLKNPLETYTSIITQVQKAIFPKERQRRITTFKAIPWLEKDLRKYLESFKSPQQFEKFKEEFQERFNSNVQSIEALRDSKNAFQENFKRISEKLEKQQEKAQTRETELQNEIKQLKFKLEQSESNLKRASESLENYKIQVRNIKLNPDNILNYISKTDLVTLAENVKFKEQLAMVKRLEAIEAKFNNLSKQNIQEKKEEFKHSPFVNVQEKERKTKIVVASLLPEQQNIIKDYVKDRADIRFVNDNSTSKKIPACDHYILFSNKTSHQVQEIAVSVLGHEKVIKFHGGITKLKELIDTLI